MNVTIQIHQVKCVYYSDDCGGLAAMRQNGGGPPCLCQMLINIDIIFRGPLASLFQRIRQEEKESTLTLVIWEDNSKVILWDLLYTLDVRSSSIAIVISCPAVFRLFSAHHRIPVTPLMRVLILFLSLLNIPFPNITIETFVLSSLYLMGLHLFTFSLTKSLIYDIV